MTWRGPAKNYGHGNEKNNKKQENSEIMLTICRNPIVQTVGTPFFQANLGPLKIFLDLYLDFVLLLARGPSCRISVLSSTFYNL